MSDMKQHRQLSNTICWLRIAYWIGITLDLLFGAIIVFCPALSRSIWRLDLPIQGASLMWSKYFGSHLITWAFLLLWAVRKPLERRGVLFLTCAPGLVGLISVEVYAMIYHIASPFSLRSLIGMQVVGGAVLLSVFVHARNHSANSADQ